MINKLTANTLKKISFWSQTDHSKKLTFFKEAILLLNIFIFEVQLLFGVDLFFISNWAFFKIYFEVQLLNLRLKRCSFFLTERSFLTIRMSKNAPPPPKKNTRPWTLCSGPPIGKQWAKGLWRKADNCNCSDLHHICVKQSQDEYM